MPIDDVTFSEQTVPFKNSALDNCQHMLTECEINNRIKETEQKIGILQPLTEKITTDANDLLLTVMEAQGETIKKLEKQMKTKTQECELLQKQIDDKSSNEDIVPHDNGRFDNCARCTDMLKECETNSIDKQQMYGQTCQSNLDKKEAECKVMVDQKESDLEIYKKIIEQNDTLYKSNLEQKHTDCQNTITTIQQEHNRDNVKAGITCAENVHYWTSEKKSCDKREHDCRNQKNDLKRENEELKKQIGKKSNGSQSTPNSSIIICVGIIVLLLGLCIYLYFFKR